MTTTYSTFAEPTIHAVVKPTRKLKTIRERFEAFHTANPEVFELFTKFAKEVRSTGRTRYSADAIIQRVRWHCNFEVHSDGEFRIDDHHTAYFARLLIATDLSFKGFFQTKTLRSS